MKNKVWYYRTEQNISLRKLSQMSHISISELSCIENEFTNDILLSNAIAIANALNIDIYELFCIPSNKNKGDGNHSRLH